ncbi:recombinase family protein [Sinorhizobium meliloti]|nr:recombinase family protein [Sinorhizobium meliloti]
MKRAVIYARYSTDLQNDQSVEDQIRLCKAHAERLGLQVVQEYFDRAKSGASMFGRPGLSSLMQAAEMGAFDVLVSEAPDRISRDIADLATIHKILTFRGIEMNCVNGGRMDTVQIGMHGVIGQMQREEGAKKVKRGMVGVVRSGRNAGGKAYGYRPVLGKKGELEIVEEEATTVRRIFELYVTGFAPRTIAATLNAEGIPAPRGLRWNGSTINGNGQRGNGILRNPIYAGKLIWNRVHMVKDPSTGRRISRINPESEYEEIDAPHLRIVDQSLFDAVQARKEATGGPRPRDVPKSKRLLSGLLRCGCCGGGMALMGVDRSGPRIQCSTYRESRSCTNGARYYIEKIERQVLDSLRIQFADTSVIEEYVKAYREERRRIEAQAHRNRSASEKALADAKAGITRIVERIAKGLIEDDEALALLLPLRQERDRLERELAASEAPSNVIELHPQAVKRFRENVEQLADVVATKTGTVDVGAVSAFRQLVAAVIVHPREKGEPYTIQIKGYLSSLIDSTLSAISLVAEEGFEPPTQGL